MTMDEKFQAFRLPLMPTLRNNWLPAITFKFIKGTTQNATSMEFVLGGLAAMGASVFTNPLEVLKTRMQLQGELKAKGQHVVHYKNIVNAAVVIAKNDGIISLQKGLVPAMWVQLVMNGLRFGSYQLAERKGYIRDENGKLMFYNSLMISGIGGMLGQYFSNPLSMVKTHLQNEAKATIAVGHQHHHTGSWAALKNLYRRHGIKGLFRGGVATLPRGYVASTAQLTAFSYSKQYLVTNYKYFEDKPILTSFLGSMVGGVAISIMVTPFDLILTRLYNQPTDEKGKGKFYNNYLDCVVKIYKTEGLYAFFKGLGPIYFRLGPHTVLCLIFWDKLKEMHEQYMVQRTRRMY